MPHKLEQNIPV